MWATRARAHLPLSVIGSKNTPKIEHRHVKQELFIVSLVEVTVNCQFTMKLEKDVAGSLLKWEACHFVEGFLLISLSETGATPTVGRVISDLHWNVSHVIVQHARGELFILKTGTQEEGGNSKELDSQERTCRSNHEQWTEMRRSFHKAAASPQPYWGNFHIPTSSLNYPYCVIAVIQQKTFNNTQW